MPTSHFPFVSFSLCTATASCSPSLPLTCLSLFYLTFPSDVLVLRPPFLTHIAILNVPSYLVTTWLECIHRVCKMYKRASKAKTAARPCSRKPYRVLQALLVSSSFSCLFQSRIHFHLLPFYSRLDLVLTGLRHISSTPPLSLPPFLLSSLLSLSGLFSSFSELTSRSPNPLSACQCQS